MAPRGPLPAELPIPRPLRLGGHSQAHLEAFQVVDVDGPVATDGCQPVPIRARRQQVNGLGAACRDPRAERRAGSPKHPETPSPTSPLTVQCQAMRAQTPPGVIHTPLRAVKGDTRPGHPQGRGMWSPGTPSSTQLTPEGGCSVSRCLQPPGSSSWKTWTDPRVEATKRLSESAENWSWKAGGSSLGTLGTWEWGECSPGSHPTVTNTLHE